MSPDAWDDGAAYERYVGRWSRLVAAEFVPWLALPAGSSWLDVGCGTGALAATILAVGNPRLVVGCDRSGGFTEFARQQTTDARIQFVVTAPPDLPAIDGGFDAVVSGLVLNFLEVPIDALGIMARRAHRGGTVAAYVWDYADRMQLIRVFWDAAAALDAAAQELDEGSRFPVCHPEPLRQAFERAGLRDIAVHPIEVPTVFRDFDEYWRPFLGGQGPAPGYAMSLPEGQRDDLRDEIRRRLPIAPDGRVFLTARAWAVRGIV